MRELLLLISILLGQLTPNTSLSTQVENNLRLAPKSATQKLDETGQERIIASPTKTVAEDYTATAKAVYSIDLTSNKVLTSKDTDTRLPIASLTKLMTAYIILKEEKTLTRVVTVDNPATQDGDSTMGLINGDSVTIQTLLEGLLITSGSDAAGTLATMNSGNTDAFVHKMNAYATSLNLKNTHFTNPVGWDNAQNYSSAKDMTELTRILLRNELFAHIVATEAKTVTTTSGRAIVLNTTNQLLHTLGYSGVKTGYTYGAGECLITLYKDKETQIITTIIGSANRFGETDSIKGWILNHFSW